MLSSPPPDTSHMRVEATTRDSPKDSEGTACFLECLIAAQLLKHVAP